VQDDTDINSNPKTPRTGRPPRGRIRAAASADPNDPAVDIDASRIEASESRGDRPERADRVDRVDRVDRADRVDRVDREDRVDRVDREDRVDRVDREDRADRVDREDRPDRTDRADRTERADREERAEAGERDRAERPERFERSERARPPERGPERTFERAPERVQERGPERYERYDRGDRHDRHDRGQRFDRQDRGPRFDRNRGETSRVQPAQPMQRAFQPNRQQQERYDNQPRSFTDKEGVAHELLSVRQLEEKTRAELVEYAKLLEIKDLQRIKKRELIVPILEAQAKAAGLHYAIGVLEMMQEGYGFLRRENMRSGPHDVYISQSQIRRFELRTGDLVAGQIREPKDNEKYQGILKVEAVNGEDPEAIRGRPQFDKLVPIYPETRLKMETSPLEMCGRVFDLFCPIGSGQRGLIVSPPKAGKTTLLKKIANAIASNHPDVDLFALLVDERPEEVTDMRRSIEGEVVSSTFDEHPDSHTAVAELTLERCKRLVELGHDVVILLDSITRLARAWNQVMPTTGRTLSGGLDTSALHRPKRFFGAARNIENGGSLTIIATALIETGSKMDDVIFEEFKGTGNMEINLVRKLADSRIFPAVDIKRSGTRHEELLLSEIELRKVVMLRRATAVLGTQEMTELVLERFRRTDGNEDFLKSVTKEAMSMAGDGER
jgi:transcription termination factor Rho